MILTKKDYKNYRKKIDEIINNKNFIFMSEYTAFFNKKDDFVIITHLVEPTTFITDKRIKKVKKIIYSSSEKNSIKKIFSKIKSKFIDLGNIK